MSQLEFRWYVVRTYSGHEIKVKSFLESELIDNEKIRVKIQDILVPTEKVFEVKREIMISKTEKDKTYSERKYSSIDSAIDEEIYKLYNLSIDEIKIIESI